VALSEFDLIGRYFSRLSGVGSAVVLGVGDDCALLSPPAGMELAVSVDTLVEGVHFPPAAEPEALGHRSLAVALSDLAAMGAQPSWATLALTLPVAEESWLGAFSRGFYGVAERFRVALVGGDTTRGPLAISVQVGGYVPAGKALRRSGARPGDLVYVTGTLGDAGLGLLIQQRQYFPPAYGLGLRDRLERPTPRVSEGMALLGVASAAIDVSDGLAADLGHILEASGVGAALYLERLPMSDAVCAYVADTGDWNLPLSAGDDYELCLTVPSQRQPTLDEVGADFDCALSWVGVIEKQGGLRCVREGAQGCSLEPRGYRHF
jgi:thiamine-monophosphate kinase